MKKKLFSIGLVLLAFGTITAFNTSASFEDVKATTYSWIQTAGPSCSIDAYDNGVQVTGMTVHGSNVACTQFFDLDGLSFNFLITGMQAGDYGGFSFGAETPNSSGSQLGFSESCAPNIVFWPNLFGSGQMRIWFGATHDYNKQCYLYSDAACTKNYAYNSITTTLVFTLNQNAQGYYGGAHFKFERYNSTVYKVTLIQLDAGQITQYNPNYDASTASCYVFVPISFFKAIGLTDHCYINLSNKSSGSSCQITMNGFNNSKHTLPSQTEWDTTTGLVSSNTGYGVRIDDLVGWGQKAVKKTKVHLDGLSFNFKMSKYQPGDCAGFYFTNSSTLNDGTGFSSLYSPCFSVMMARNIGGQTYSSFHVGEDHDCYNKPSVIYRDTSLTQLGFSSSSNDLYIKPTLYNTHYYTGFNVLFEKFSSYYKVTFSQETLFGSFVSSSAANYYNQGSNYRVAMYLPLSAFNGRVDSNGDTYLTVAGFAANASVTTESFLLVDNVKSNLNLLTFCNNITNNLTCDPQGRTAPSTSYWNTLNQQYYALSIDDKNILQFTKSNTSSGANTIEKALAKYDYIISKYKTSHTNFISRNPSTLRVNESILKDDTASIISVTLISSVAVLSFVSFIFIKKKKEAKR